MRKATTIGPVAAIYFATNKSEPREAMLLTPSFVAKLDIWYLVGEQPKTLKLRLLPDVNQS
jgi:hypothetical protein